MDAANNQENGTVVILITKDQASIRLGNLSKNYSHYSFFTGSLEETLTGTPS
jgi:hypothetical protein